MKCGSHIRATGRTRLPSLLSHSSGLPCWARQNKRQCLPGDRRRRILSELYRSCKQKRSTVSVAMFLCARQLTVIAAQAPVRLARLGFWPPLPRPRRPSGTARPAACPSQVPPPPGPSGVPIASGKAFWSGGGVLPLRQRPPRQAPGVRRPVGAPLASPHQGCSTG